MAKTEIEWADCVWNPITGCDHVSEGCRNCYAERMSYRLRGRFGYPYETPFRVTVHDDRFTEPLRWRKPRRVFVCSMGDLYHPDVRVADLVRIWQIMAETPQHTYMVLTKRPWNMFGTYGALCRHGVLEEGQFLPNVWLGVSCEHRGVLYRIPVLFRVPAAKYFVSLEPLLESVDLTSIQIPYELDYPLFNALTGMWRRHVAEGACAYDEDRYFATDRVEQLDWVIVGGETGPGARPIKPAWVRLIRGHCEAYGVPFFFKGWGGPRYEGWVLDERKSELDPPCWVMYSGRELDGRTWDQYPEGAQLTLEGANRGKQS